MRDFNSKSRFQLCMKYNYKRLISWLSVFAIAILTQICTRAASVSFPAVYVATDYSTAGYSINTQNITIKSSLQTKAGTSASFSTLDPTAATFPTTGNNENGVFSYYDVSGNLHSYTGTISRRDTSGSKVYSFYFVQTSGATPYIAVLLVCKQIPAYTEFSLDNTGHYVSTTSTGSVATSVGTNSAPVDLSLQDYATALNSVLASSTITVVGNSTYAYTGSATGPYQSTVTGSTGSVTYSYVGTSGTTYGPSSTRPSASGSYTVTATVAADSNYKGATSAAFPFTIVAANASTITVVGNSTYAYTGSATGPYQSTVTGSNGLVTYSYVGTGGTTYGPSTTQPSASGSYTVTATVAADSYYTTATSTAFPFTILASGANSIVVIGNTSYPYISSATGPYQSVVTGPGGVVTYSYSGTGGTSYGPSSTQPTLVGAYSVTATVTGTSTATSDPFAFSITPATPSIVVNNTGPYTYSGSPIGPNTSTTPSTGLITYSYNGTGGTTYGPSSTPPTLPGTYVVVATVAADPNYFTAASDPLTFTITGPSTISVTGSSAYPYTGSVTGPNTSTVTGSTGAVTYSYLGTGGTTYGPSSTRPTLPGSYQVVATLAPDAIYTGASSSAFPFAINSASQVITFPSIGDQIYGIGPIALRASASSTLPVSYSIVSGPATVSGSTLTITGTGTVVVTASQGGGVASGVTYSAATNVQQSFNVTAAQTINFPPIPDQIFGAGPITLNATASSGLTVYYLIVSGPATVSGSTLTITGLGRVVVDAYQLGGTVNGVQYGTAASVAQSFNVTKLPQVITFPPIGAQAVGGTPVALNATASSGLPVSYTLVSGPATLSGNSLSFTATGNVVVTASQAGNATYMPATDVTQTITVNLTNPTLTWSNPSPIGYGTPLSSIQLNALASVPGTYSYSPALGIVLPVGQQTLKVIFTPTDTTKYATISTTVTITVNPVPPTISMPPSLNCTTIKSVSLSAATGQSIVVTDQTPGMVTLSLSVQNGTLSLSDLKGSVVTTGNQSNSNAIIIQGSLDQINAALTTLVYNPSPTSPPYSIDILNAQALDSLAQTASGVTDIYITNQLFGGTAQTANLNTLIIAPKKVGSMTIISWDPSILMPSPSITPNWILSFQAYATNDGSVIRTTIGVKVVYTDGTSDIFNLPITIYQPTIQALNGTTSPANLNPQTSLYEQTVLITNPTIFPIVSYTVNVTGLPSGVVLESASGYQSNGSPYVTGVTALTPGSSVKLLLEYFSPNAQPFLNPQLSMQVTQATSTQNPTGTVVPLQQVVTGYSGRTYVQFQTVAGKTYWIQYRDSSTAPWQTSQSSMIGTGQPASWLDYGPPKTSSIPTSQRTYQVLLSTP